MQGTRAVREMGYGYGAMPTAAGSREGFVAGSHVDRNANFHACRQAGGAGESHRIDLVDGDCCDRAFAGFAGAWTGFEDRHELLARVTCPSICFGIPAVALLVTSVSLAHRGDLGLGIGIGVFAGVFSLTWLGCVAGRIGCIVKRESDAARVMHYFGP